MSQALSLTVTGMKCAGCEAHAKSQLQALEGVLSVVADHKAQHIKLEFEAEKIGLAAITQAIHAAGYRVES
jgi:copper chaperone